MFGVSTDVADGEGRCEEERLRRHRLVVIGSAAGRARRSRRGGWSRRRQQVLAQRQPADAPEEDTLPAGEHHHTWVTSQRCTKPRPPSCPFCLYPKKCVEGLPKIVVISVGLGIVHATYPEKRPGTEPINTCRVGTYLPVGPKKSLPWLKSKWCCLRVANAGNAQDRVLLYVAPTQPRLLSEPQQICGEETR